MNPEPSRFVMIAVLLGALVAVGEGFTHLGCASTPSIIITISGSFGAGAALAVFVMERRARVRTASSSDGRKGEE